MILICLQEKKIYNINPVLKMPSFRVSGEMGETISQGKKNKPPM